MKLDLDGLVVIGGDDFNMNVVFLGEYFRVKKVRIYVIGCLKIIDGDLKFLEVLISFGFDIVCKIYVEMIGNIMVDV